MIRIAILDDYANRALESADWSSLEETKIQVFTHHLGHNVDVVADALNAFDVIVAMRERTPFPASLIEKLPNLRLLVTTGMRNLSFDLEAGRRYGVDICGTESLAYPAFEHTWALILALTKQIPFEDRAMKSGGWQQGTGIGLNGKVLGILGLGNLGSKVAMVGNAFEMEVIAWSENLNQGRCDQVGRVKCVDKNELFERADIISIHLILSERTRNLIGAAELALMKSCAYLINTSRGPIIDENALLDCLQMQRIAGAAIDVFDVEPLPVEHPYRGLTNMVLTGHTGYVVEELYTYSYNQVIENIKAWLLDKPIRLLNA